MFCNVCKREKHSGHFGMRRKREGYSFSSSTRLPICDTCQSRVVDETASDIAEDIVQIHVESLHEKTLPRR